jgi:hypothetical protein
MDTEMNEKGLNDHSISHHDNLNHHHYQFDQGHNRLSEYLINGRTSGEIKDCIFDSSHYHLISRNGSENNQLRAQLL